jgi:hypothetical protein
MAMVRNYLSALAFMAAILSACTSTTSEVETIQSLPTETQNTNYTAWRQPLVTPAMLRLTPGSIKPEGWILEMLERQRDGLVGHLGEISSWLDKNNNAWLSQGGDHGWEEVPYWLKGYSSLAFVLGDKSMMDEAMVWINATIENQREDGDFGPISMDGDHRDFWPQMIMLWTLQDYYEYSGDKRVLDLMTKYFQFQAAYPEEDFLKTYWANSRGGDNLYSVLWLYNITGESWLLDLAEKIHRNTADWNQDTNLPNWHNVNIAQCFREPATYYMLSKDSTMLRATYRDFDLIRRTFGQVPGGMFGSDENCRLGYIDPRQGVETCGMVEQMASDELLLRFTGDPFWAENCEDVAFNTYPAAMMPDQKSLRYITCPNMTISDSKNHSPSIQNAGPFLAMNPFSSRCCQHNHGQGWPYYAEHLVMASEDNGVAIALYGACTATVKVGNGEEITLREETHYPFEEDIKITISAKQDVDFPMYLRIPSWTEGATISIDGRKSTAREGKYFRISRTWSDGDVVLLHFPMRVTSRVWDVNKHSVSLDYGPLTLSLKIGEKYVKEDSRATAVWDSHWQENADASKWPTYTISPSTPWNYALIDNSDLRNLKITKKPWPEDNYPFTLESVPLEFSTTGMRVPSWTYDATGMCGVLPEIDAPCSAPEAITLIPMGAARLRISAFPLRKSEGK